MREVAVSNQLQEDALLRADIPSWVYFLKSLKPEMTKVKELVLKEECSYTQCLLELKHRKVRLR